MTKLLGILLLAGVVAALAECYVVGKSIRDLFR